MYGNQYVIIYERKSAPVLALLKEFEQFQSINLNVIYNSVFPAMHDSLLLSFVRGGVLLTGTVSSIVAFQA